MRISVWSLFNAALLCLILSTNPAFGQSLAISKKPDATYWIEGNAPVENPGTLQISDNLHLWVDLQENIQQPYSVALDTNGVTERYFRLTPTVPAAPPIVVMLIGDSMSADCCGWGSGLRQYFKENVTFVNYAQPWTSSRTFFQSAEYDKMLLVKPNYLFMQFAYSEPGIPEDEYMNNLRTIIQLVRGWDGVPIMITLHAARLWDSQGVLVPSEHPYNALMKQVGVQTSTTVIDLYPITRKLFQELGPVRAEFMKWAGDPEDGVHTSPLGAIWISRLLTHAFPDNFGPYLTGIFDPPPNP